MNTKLLRDSETVLFPGSQNISTKMMTFEFLLQGVQSSEAKEVIGLLLQSVHIGL